MVSYNKITGIFEFSPIEARVWCARLSIPAECMKHEYGSPAFYACLLRLKGLDVVQVGRSFLRVKEKPNRVWEALAT
jgi:hypothetical protein